MCRLGAAATAGPAPGTGSDRGVCNVPGGNQVLPCPSGDSPSQVCAGPASSISSTSLPSPRHHWWPHPEAAPAALHSLASHSSLLVPPSQNPIFSLPLEHCILFNPSLSHWLQHCFNWIPKITSLFTRLMLLYRSTAWAGEGSFHYPGTR